LPWSVPSSFFTHLYFFSHFCRLEFQNSNLFVPYDTLLWDLIWVFELWNLISHEGAMRFLVKGVAWSVPSSFLTHLHFFSSICHYEF
jgi:hypothetical protein